MSLMSLPVKIAGKLAGLALLAGASIGGYLWFDYHSNNPQRIIEEQARQIEYLENVAVRLTGRSRIAKIVVTDQVRNDDDQLVTTLLFIEQNTAPLPAEIGTDGPGEPLYPATLPARKFVAVGDAVHIDAKIIRFEDHFVADGDPLRGKSLALFTGLYGSATPPEQAEPIDPEGRAPRVYADRVDRPSLDEERARFEANLWKEFWRLTHDPAYAEQNGVDVAYGNGVWGALRPGYVYELELDHDGGLVLRTEAMPDVYRHLLQEITGVGPDSTAPVVVPQQ